jgi:hypothetical protein
VQGRAPASDRANEKVAPAIGDEVDSHEGANFDNIVAHFYASRAAPPGDPVHATYRVMLESWEKLHGHITSSYFCRNVVAAAAITDQDQLFSAGNPYRKKADLPLYTLITRADHLNRFVEDRLVGIQRRSSIADIYAIQTIALACMDDLSASPPPRAEAAAERRSVTVSKIQADLAEAEQYIFGVWQRRAQVSYLQGMGLGVAGVAIVVGLVAAALTPLIGAYPDIPARIDYVPWVLILGAIGAVLSVMQRLTSGNLHLRVDSSISENRTLGVFRPVIGSALGLALLILVLGGLIPVKIPDDVQTRAFFLTGLAFLAGFSERFAQDMIGTATATQIAAAQPVPTDASAVK